MPWLSSPPLTTVYLGGGTPTVLGERLLDVLEATRRHFGWTADAEVTAEANPESLDHAGARRLAEAGVTRVSLGVQSLDDEVSRVLGRPHDGAQALEACAAARDARLALALDLICGVPGQTADSWRRTLEAALGVGPAHVSVYPLTLEEGTPLAAEVSRGAIAEPDPDAAAAMMLEAAELLPWAGLLRYEVANYAATGHESRHNTAYWTGRSYLAVGLGGHGMLSAAQARTAGLVGDEVAEDARVRYANQTPPSEEPSASPAAAAALCEVLTAAEAKREDVMLGLRMTRGVTDAAVEAAGLAAALEPLVAEGLLERTGTGLASRWRTTERGWLLGNVVFEAAWTGDGGV